MDQLKVLLLVFLLLRGIFPGQSQAQDISVIPFDSLSVDWSGTLQPQLTYAYGETGDGINESYGASVRRARLLLNGNFAEELHFFIQFEGFGGSNNVTNLLDARISYQFHPNFQLRFGRFFMPQPRSFVYTPHRVMDGINRAAIAERWGASTVGADGRDYGLEVQYKSKEWEWVAAIHNGHNKLNLKTGISRFNNNPVNPTKGIAGSFYGAYTPEFIEGWEIGGYYGFNEHEGSYTELFDQGRSYHSFSSHLYWGAVPGSQPVRLKADFIGTNYEEVNDVTQHYRGYSFLSAVRLFPWMEVFARGENMNDHKSSILEDSSQSNDTSYILNGGLTVSFSALNDLDFMRNKMVLVFAEERWENDNIGKFRTVQLQYQLVF